MYARDRFRLVGTSSVSFVRSVPDVSSAIDRCENTVKTNVPREVVRGAFRFEVDINSSHGPAFVHDGAGHASVSEYFFDYGRLKTLTPGVPADTSSGPH